MPTNKQDWSSPAEPKKDENAYRDDLLREKVSKLTGDPQATGLSSVKPNLKSYIGTKVILARPMTENEFLKTVKGKTDEELHKQETQGNGYEVTYEDGYVSWSPKAVFERCYREITSQERGLIHTAGISPAQ
jgi:hypothetical protein